MSEDDVRYDEEAARTSAGEPVDDVLFAEVMHDAAQWGEAVLLNRDGSPRRYWAHQIDDLHCPSRNIIHLDGRDSGKCLPGSTTLVDVDSGELIRMDTLTPGRRICVLGPDLRLTTTREYTVLRNGPKPCFRLQTATGRAIEATTNHPVLTERGWLPLSDLQPGDFLAVPRSLPLCLPDAEAITDEELCLLAYLIADGGLAHGAVVFTKEDPLVVDEFTWLVRHCFPETMIRRATPIAYRIALDRSKVTTVRNPCITWLRQLRLMGCRSAEKRLPEIVMRCSLRQQALFLARLFGCDGWFAVCNASEGTPHVEVGYCSASFALADGVRHLLLRFGIMSTLRKRIVNDQPYWSIAIGDHEHIRRFARRIGLVGRKHSVLEEYLAEETVQHGNAHDRVPARLVAAEVCRLRQAGLSTATITGNPNRRLRLHRYHPTRGLVADYADNTESVALHDLAAGDLYWDRVVAIESMGIHETYDLSVPGYHNFVANDIIVHNSISLTTDALHFATTTPGGQGLIAAPHQGHLDSLIEEIDYQIETSEMLRALVALNQFGKLKIMRKPYYRIEFLTGSVLYFRPAGVYGDAFRSLHVERVWVDEGAWLTEAAWKALRQCLKAGGRLRIYSTPNGLRNTTYFRLTSSKQFTVFRWPSWVNPHWTEQRERELVEFYGGKDTAGWQHEVAGEHGKPSYGAFIQEHFDAACQDILEYRTVRIGSDDLAGCQANQHLFDAMEAMLDLTPQAGVFWIGADLGYTNDPTEIVVFQDASGESAATRLVLRIHCERVAYPILSMLIALLERYYAPAGIGIDNGGNGGAVVQELLTLDAYRSLNLSGRLRGIDFGGVTVLPTPDGGEVRKRTKELMTSLINGMLQRREIQFPHADLELQDQFTTHTYTMTNNAIVYSKGNDHIIDAVRCAVLVREMGQLGPSGRIVVPPWTPLLTDPIFI